MKVFLAEILTYRTDSNTCLYSNSSLFHIEAYFSQVNLSKIDTYLKDLVDPLNDACQIHLVRSS